MLTDERTVTTEETYTSLQFVYARSSYRQDDDTQPIDMPTSLLGALHFIAVKFAVTALMDEGLQMSGAFDTLGDNMIDNYLRSAGMLNMAT